MAPNIERIAMRGGEMPDGLDLPDQMYFLSLRMLHTQYKQGIITKEVAASEKGKLWYNRDKWYRKLGIADGLNKRSAELWKNVEVHASEYAKNRTLENADKLYHDIYGMWPNNGTR